MDIWTLLILAVLLGAGVTLDTVSHRLPNWLTLGGAALVLGWALFPGAPAVGHAAAGWILGLLLFLPMYLLRWMGAGDTKFLAAIGACAGPYAVLNIGLLAMAIGALISLAWLAAKGELGDFLRRWGGMLLFMRAGAGLGYVAPAPDSVARRRFPFAAPIALATVLVLLMPGGG